MVVVARCLHLLLFFFFLFLFILCSAVVVLFLNVAQVYEDKYQLVERGSRAAVSAVLVVLDSLGAGPDAVDQMMSWNLAKKTVTLRLVRRCFEKKNKQKKTKEKNLHKPIFSSVLAVLQRRVLILILIPYIFFFFVAKNCRIKKKKRKQKKNFDCLCFLLDCFTYVFA